MTTPTKAESLSDRIRSEAAIADRPGQMARLEAIADEVDRLQRGAAPVLPAAAATEGDTP